MAPKSRCRFAGALFFVMLVAGTSWAIDFGDAPDSYGTLLASNGARHITTGPILGAIRDDEPDGQPSVDADGDNLNGVPNYTLTTIPFNFLDISSTGTPLGLGDDSMSPALFLGFTFNFYGINYTNVFVCANGFLTFLPGQNAFAFFGSTPTPGNPDGLIAGWWADLVPGAGP